MQSIEEIQNILTNCWKELLGRQEIGIHDDFFESGGDSIIALRLISRVSDALGRGLSFRILYSLPTIAGLSAHLASVSDGNAGSRTVTDQNGDRSHEEIKFLPFIPRLQRDGIDWYPVTPVLIYWLDPSIDRPYKAANPLHGIHIKDFDVLGPFGTETLCKAVSWLVHRHESLRAAFRLIDGVWHAMLLDATDPRFLPDCRSTADFTPDNEKVIDFALFHDQAMDIENGPLFQVRVYRHAADKHVLSIRIHHVIFDAWTSDVMIRDLLIAYEAFAAGSTPPLPPLKKQFKDYHALENLHRRKYRKVHRRYWENLYSSLPPEPHIPGAHPGSPDISGRIRAAVRMDFPRESVDFIHALARQTGAGLFQILQAGFIVFFRDLTGVDDILIGTYIFGRDYPGNEDQIGCYARTVLIRTVLDPGDSLSESLAKTRQANSAMHNFTAFTLKERMEELLPAGETLYGKYWKINLQYAALDQTYIGRDEAAEILERLDLETLPRYREQDSLVIPIDMQWHFLHAQDQLQVLVEYDRSRYDEAIITGLINDFLASIGHAALENDQVRYLADTH